MPYAREAWGVPVDRRNDRASRVHRLEGNAIDGVCIVMQDPEGNEFCLD